MNALAHRRAAIGRAPGLVVALAWAPVWPLVWALVWALVCVVAVLPGRCRAEQSPADATPAEGAPTVTAAAEEKEALAEREQRLLSQYRDLEKTFLRLADLLAPSDPRRAAVLRGVFEQARDQEVGTRLDTIVELLGKGQLLKAGSSQASAIEQLRELLTLLEAGDSDRHRSSAKEEVKQFLARVSKLIAKQRDIEGATEGAAAGEALAQRQDALATETADLSRDLGGFAKRMEVRDPGGETVPPKGASDEGAEAGEGAGKEGAGKEGAGKEGADKEGADKEGQSSAEGQPGEEIGRAHV